MLVALRSSTFVDNTYRKTGLDVLRAAPIVGTGYYLDSGGFRYMVVPFAMTVVLASAVFASALAHNAHHLVTARIVFAISALVVVGIAMALVTQLPSITLGRYRSNWRDTSNCAADVLRREDGEALLTEYWQAKPLMLFSDGRVHALQMRAMLRRPNFWINSRGWYRGTHRFGVVAVNGLNPASIVRSFGEPARVDHCGGIELFVFRDRARVMLAGKMQRMFARFMLDPHPL